MAVFQLADRIKETSTIVGTGTATLLGAETGFRGFSTFPDGDTVYYVFEAIDANGVPTGQWETGVGTVGGVGTTLARTTPKQGSSGVATLVNFAAGTKNVFVDEIASASMQANSSTTQILFNNAGVVGGFGAWDGTTLGLGVGKRLQFSGALASFDLRASDDAVPYLQIGGDFPIVRNSIGAENGVPIAIHNSDFTLVNAGNGNYINFFQSNGTIAAPTELGIGDGCGVFNFGAFYDDGGAGYYDFATSIQGVVDADYAGFANSYAVALQLVAWGQSANGYGSNVTLRTNGNVNFGLNNAFQRVGLRATATNELSVVQPESTSVLATIKAANFAATPAVGASALTVANVTQTASFPVLDLAQTWNNAGVTFTGLKLNVTSTASAAASMLLDLQVASASVFAVLKTGTVSLPNVATALFNSLETNSSFGFALGTPSIYKTGTLVANFATAATSILNRINLTNNIGSGSDVILMREADNILQMGVDVNGAPVTQTVKSHDGITGTDIAGAPFILGSGRGTGAGTISYLAFQTPTVLASGTTAQTLTERVRIDSSGIKATGYKSSDGSAGVTFGPAGVASITVKDGIVTAIS